MVSRNGADVFLCQRVVQEQNGKFLFLVLFLLISNVWHQEKRKQEKEEAKKMEEEMAQAQKEMAEAEANKKDSYIYMANSRSKVSNKEKGQIFSTFYGI